jgi:hypothetical protein
MEFSWRSTVNLYGLTATLKLERRESAALALFDPMAIAN